MRSFPWEVAWRQEAAIPSGPELPLQEKRGPGIAGEGEGRLFCCGDSSLPDGLLSTEFFWGRREDFLPR